MAACNAFQDTATTYYCPNDTCQHACLAKALLLRFGFISSHEETQQHIHITASGMRYLLPVFEVFDAVRTFSTSRNLEPENCTILELCMELYSQGWNDKCESSRSNMPAYVQGGSKFWYYHSNFGPIGGMNKPYLMVLLKADDFLQAGLNCIHHGQLVSYYTTLLNIDIARISSVTPNQPKKFYDCLLGHVQCTSGTHKDTGQQMLSDFSDEQGFLKSKQTP
jgi:hypothetical protein